MLLTEDKLKKLLTKNETARLDFKRKLHRIYERNENDPNFAKKQKDELVKDILALANGNIHTASDPGYLIIGRKDKLNGDGSYTLYDVDYQVPDEAHLRDWVNAKCDIPLHDIDAQIFTLDGKRLFVIEILPDRYVRETTTYLETPDRYFSEYITLIRHGEGIRIASRIEREVLIEQKQRWYDAQREIKHPVVFVGSITFFISVLLFYAIFIKHPLVQGYKIAVWTASVILALLTSFYTAIITYGYRKILFIRTNWLRFSKSMKALIIFFVVVSVFVIIWGLSGVI